MKGRFLVVGVCVATVMLVCGCSSAGGSPSSGTSRAAPASSTSASASASASGSLPHLFGWAVLMCLVTGSLQSAHLDSLADGDDGLLRQEIGQSLHLVQTSARTVDSIKPTGDANADKLTGQLRQAVDSTTPQITDLLNPKGPDPAGRVARVNKLLSAIHPNGDDLFNAAQSEPDIGNAYTSTESCPTQAPPAD
jgi:hypothetical protein